LPKIQLKKLKKADLPVLFIWRSQKRVCHLINSAPPRSFKHHLEWFSKIQNNRREAHYGIYQGKNILGAVWLANINRKRKQAEVRIYLGNSPHRKRGSGTEAICLISRTAAWLGVPSLRAYCWVKNLPAVHAFEKAGFQKASRKLLRYWKSLGRKVEVFQMISTT